jgi:hypothetical protein
MPQPNRPDAAGRAREQAAAYESIFAPTPLQLDNDQGVIEIPPHPNLHMLDDDRQQAYDELLFEIESYDREPDLLIPEQTLDSGMVLPAETKRGALLVPYRKDGQLIKPPHSVRVVQAALGDTEYARLRAGGKSAADVWRIWNDQGLRAADRETFRSLPNGRPNAVAPISR